METAERPRINESGTNQKETQANQTSTEDIFNRANYWKDRQTKQVSESTSPSVKKTAEASIERYKGIIDALLKFKAGGRFPDIKRMQAEINSRFDKLNSFTGKSREPFEDELVKLEHAQAFVNQEVENAEKPKTKDVDYEAWLKEKEVEKQKAQQERESRAKAVDKTKITEVRDNLESAHEKELFDMVLRDGGVEISASMYADATGKGSHGIKELADPSVKFSSDSFVDPFVNIDERGLDLKQKTGKRFYDVMNEMGVNEAVRLRGVTKSRKRMEKFYTGWGPFKKEETREIPDGYESVSHKDLVDDGKDEPAYEFIYKTFQKYDDEKGWVYKEPSGRNQELSIRIILPESEAKTFYEQSKTDPNFLRRAIEKIVVEKLGQNGDIRKAKDKWKDAWESGRERIVKDGKLLEEGYPAIKPPYKEWEKIPDHHGKSKMLFQDLHDEGSLKGYPKPIDKCFVAEFVTK